MQSCIDYPEGMSAFISIEGSSYTPELEDSIRQELSSAIPTMTRGCKTPAAGPAITTEALIAFFSEVPADIRAALVGMLLASLVDTISKTVRKEPVLKRCIIRNPTYDINILDDAAVIDGEEPVIIKQVDKTLLADIQDFVRSEASKGYSVLSVTLPCECICVNDRVSAEPGRGSINLWKVSYRDGMHRYSMVYDNANKQYIK